MTDTSKSAKKLMASVRGMGVADIISWWTSRLCFKGKALGDAEAVLFVHNHQAQILELDVV